MLGGGRFGATDLNYSQSKPKPKLNPSPIYTLLSILDEVPAMPALQVPHGVDLGLLTEAADHGQVNLDIQP